MGSSAMRSPVTRACWARGNRDKFFPTVSIIDSPSGSMVRATYLIDLSAGVTDIQLRLHLETALSSCTQALSLVRPLLPEL